MKVEMIGEGIAERISFDLPQPYSWPLTWSMAWTLPLYLNTSTWSFKSTPGWLMSALTGASWGLAVLGMMKALHACVIWQLSLSKLRSGSAEARPTGCQVAPGCNCCLKKFISGVKRGCFGSWFVFRCSHYSGLQLLLLVIEPGHVNFPSMCVPVEKRAQALGRIITRYYLSNSLYISMKNNFLKI